MKQEYLVMKKLLLIGAVLFMKNQRQILKSIIATAVCALGGMGCNGYSGFYTNTGAQCGAARPGCDYFSDGKTKISIQDDPSFQSDDGANDGPGRDGFIFYFSTTYNQQVEQSPDGIIFSMSTQTALNSLNTQTKDVDLMRADLQTTDLTERAQAIAARFQMNIEAATKLTLLSDKIQQIQVAGAPMTQETSQSLAYEAFSIAGLNPTDVNSAIAKSLAGDDDAETALLASAANGLGMPSDMLKSQLLPALGIQP